jgi:hypothetical protein
MGWFDSNPQAIADALALAPTATPVAGSVYARLDGLQAAAGAILVDHNSGGTNNLAFLTDQNVGIALANVRAYLATDYDTDQRSQEAVRGTTTTDSSGHWVTPMGLFAGAYVFVFYAPRYQVTVKRYTVE